MERRIIEFLVDEGVVELDEVELYSYGLNLSLKKIIHVAIILVVGLVTGKFWGVLVFLISYMAIREYSGGYHAKTEAGCCICTVVVTINVIIMLYFLPELNSIVIRRLLSSCVVIIWILSPQDTENKPLKEEERYIYQKKTRKILIISTIVLLFGCAHTVVYWGIACGWIIQTVMLLMVVLK